MHNTNQSVAVVEGECVMSEVGTEVLCIMQINVSLKIVNYVSIRRTDALHSAACLVYVIAIPFYVAFL